MAEKRWTHLLILDSLHRFRRTCIVHAPTPVLQTNTAAARGNSNRPTLIPGRRPCLVYQQHERAKMKRKKKHECTNCRLPLERTPCYLSLSLSLSANGFRNLDMPILLRFLRTCQYTHHKRGRKTTKTHRSLPSSSLPSTSGVPCREPSRSLPTFEKLPVNRLNDDGRPPLGDGVAYGVKLWDDAGRCTCRPMAELAVRGRSEELSWAPLPLPFE